MTDPIEGDDMTIAFMGGLLGVKPDFSSITAPNSAHQVTRQTPQIKFNNVSVQSGVDALTKFFQANGSSGHVIWTFSESTVSAIQWLTAHPNDTNIWYLLGSPACPGNYNTTSSWAALPDGNFNKVTFVTKQYDSVADTPAGKANSAKSNAQLSVHTRGYDDLDMRFPDLTWTDPRTQTKTMYFLTYPLPIISTLWKSQSAIANEDKQKRPGVESQYYLAGQTQRPTKLPDPKYLA